MLNKAFNRLTGFADVEQRGNVIIISGVSASTLSRDMKYIWNTSKIASSMFIKATWSEIRIPTFFALEFQYILRKLIDSRGLYTSKRILKNVVEEVTKEILLNGADSWSSFSYGGCSLIYDCDIAERLSTPSELKKNKGGENHPNKNETWLDCQTRALTQAYRKVMRHKRNLVG